MDVPVRESGVFAFGPFRLDPVRQTLERDGVPIKLAPRLFDTLLYLLRNHGSVVTRDELIQAVWRGRTVDENNLGQAISALRKALQDDMTAEPLVVTVPWRGYRLAAPVVFEPRGVPAIGPALAHIRQAAPASSPQPSSLRFWSMWRGRVALALASLALVLALLSLTWHRPDSVAGAPGDHTDASFAPPAHSVAVLAFENLSGDPQQDSLSEGLSEQLTDALSGMPGLQVAARTSAFSVRHSNATIGEIARKLNVGAVLEGSVRRQGSHVRVTAQLINALTGFHFWSKSYDSEQTDLLAMQTDIARGVAAALQVTLLGPQVAHGHKALSTNPAAMDAYLSARKKLRAAAGEADFHAAVADFDTAVTLDPKFAAAFCSRALALAMLAANGTFNDPAATRALYDKALASADRAIALAPDAGLPHSARGVVLNWGFLDRAGALREQQVALSLAPGIGGIETNYANAEAAVGHMDAALTAARRATEMDALMPDAWGTLARIQYLARQYDAARETLDHVRVLAGGALPDRFNITRGEIELIQGRPEGASRIAATQSDYGRNLILAIADHALGRQVEAAAQLAAMQARQGDNGAFWYAVIAAQWGQPTQAFGWLETAIRSRNADLVEFEAEPLLDPLRGDARFAGIERRLNTPPQ